MLSWMTILQLGLVGNLADLAAWPCQRGFETPLLCRRLANRQFPSCLSPLFQTESCKAFHTRNCFIEQNVHGNITNFHMKGFAGLGLKPRRKVTRQSLYSCWSPFLINVNLRLTLVSLTFPSRHLLLSGGPVFTEDLWYIVCDGLKEAVQTTLLNMKQMVTCFQPSSYNVSGDEGMTVRVVARRDVTASDLIRLQQVAEQVSPALSRDPKQDTTISFPFQCWCSLLISWGADSYERLPKLSTTNSVAGDLIACATNKVWRTANYTELLQNFGCTFLFSFFLFQYPDSF